MAVGSADRGPGDAHRAGTPSGGLPSDATGEVSRYLTSLVPRPDRVDEVVALLGQRRIVTLTGRGGCGKTRLAFEVVGHVGAAHGEPIVVDLAPVEARGWSTAAVAEAVGAAESGSRSLDDAICDALASRRVLLVVDNCEHVIDECAALLVAVLRRCPEVTVLATSRAPLAIEGEALWQVPALGLPVIGDAAAGIDPREALMASEAGRLFVERAALARAHEPLSPDEAAAAAVVCWRLEGLPLAIELVAGQIRVLDLADLATSLDGWLARLESANRTTPVRQRSLEASFRWSHDLLDEPQRRLLRRLSVFAAAFRAPAAAAVADGPGRGEVARLLGDLADQSIVHLDRDEHGLRYRLPEALRPLVRERLAAVGEEDEARHRHLDHHLALTTALTADGPHEADSMLDRGEASLDDLRRALDFSLTSGRVTDGLRLAAALRWMWIDTGRIQESQRRLAALLDAQLDAGIADGAGGDDARAARADALVATATLALFWVDPAVMRRRAIEAESLGRALGDREVVGEALVLAGWAAAFMDVPAARGLLTDALVALDGTDLGWWVNFGRIGLAVALVAEGDLPAAVREARAAAERARSDDLWTAELALAILGHVELLAGDLASSLAHLQEAVSGRTFPYQAGQWHALTRAHRGDFDAAAEAFAAAEAGAASSGGPFIPGWLNYALVELGCGRPQHAAELAGRALPVLRAMGWRWAEAQAHRVLGGAAAETGDGEGARAHLRRARELGDASGNPMGRAIALVGQARLAQADGDHAEARRLLRPAVNDALRCGYHLGALEAVEALAVLTAAEGSSPAEGATLLAAVEAERERTGLVRFPADQARFAAAVAAVEDELGDDLAAAWGTGRALSFDQAAVLASRGEGRKPRPPEGWASLTDREAEVARLAARGLTNPQIAAELGVSRRTVQTHLSHAYTKLRLSSRAALAAEVTRRTGAG